MTPLAVPLASLRHLAPALQHVLALARWWQDLHEHWQRPDEVFAAVLFHDAVYTPLRSDNEEESAKLALAWLGGVGALDLAMVSDLIRLTASHGKHEATLVGDAALFLDIDLSILGAARADYRAYASGVAAEYAAVPGWLFRRKRRAFLRGLLAGGRIFLTDVLEARLGGGGAGEFGVGGGGICRGLGWEWVGGEGDDLIPLLRASRHSQSIDSKEPSFRALAARLGGSERRTVAALVTCAGFRYPNDGISLTTP